MLLGFGPLGFAGVGGGGGVDLSGYQPVGSVDVYASSFTEAVDLTALSDITVHLDAPSIAFDVLPTSAPRKVLVAFQQDGTGGRTVTVPNDWLLSPAYALWIDPRPNRVTYALLSANGEEVVLDTDHVVRDYSWTKDGDVAVSTGANPIPVYDPGYIVWVDAVCGAAPGGTPLTADMRWTPNLGVTAPSSLWSVPQANNRPIIPAGSLAPGYLAVPTTREIIPTGLRGALYADVVTRGTTPNFGQGLTIRARVLHPR